MSRRKCEKCGQEVLADKLAPGQAFICPKCGHTGVGIAVVEAANAPVHVSPADSQSTRNTQSFIGLSNDERSRTIFFLKIGYAFLIFFPLITVIYDYIQRNSFKNDSLISNHIEFQIQTFWWSLIFGFLITIVSALLTFVVIGAFLGPICLLLLYAWILYRAIRGFVHLCDSKLA
ncbi:MAG: hypothetical protein IKO41_05625 [Lachnospiraceae bacterium]|nr:hypothetical protein [Lachnospiraceae bacterium]